MKTRVLHRIWELDAFLPLASTSTVPSHKATPASSTVSYTGSRSKHATTNRSWADQATELSTVGMKPSVRLRDKCQTNTVKAVPRRLTCFVGSLSSDVTEEDMTSLLTEQGILDAHCRKITPRNGRTFNTSAFRVSCSAAFESIFYNKRSWPEGAELRDWVFFTIVVMARDVVKIVTYNLDGFNNGRSCLTDLCNDPDVSMIAVQEHWLTPEKLFLLNQLHPEFSGCGVSAMANKLVSGVFHGRPYGGVGLLWRKKLSGCMLDIRPAPVGSFLYR